MLTITESARILRQIFPNYPDLTKQNPKPPRESWALKPEHLSVEVSPDGAHHYWAGGIEVSQKDFETLERAVKSR